MIKSALTIELTFPPVSVGGRWLFFKTFQTSTSSKRYFCFQTQALNCRTSLYSLHWYLLLCRHLSIYLTKLNKVTSKGVLRLCSIHGDVSKELPRQPFKTGKIVKWLQKPGTQSTFQKTSNMFSTFCTLVTEHSISV